jgi:hypothetical protein
MIARVEWVGKERFGSWKQVTSWGVISILGLVAVVSWAETLLFYQDKRGLPRLYLLENDNNFGFRLQANRSQAIVNSDRQTTTTHTNEQGFRGVQWEAQQATSALMVGNEQVFGYGVADEETFPELLAKELKFPVRNLGVPGYGPAQYTQLLAKWVPILKPKHVFYVVDLDSDLESSPHKNIQLSAGYPFLFRNQESQRDSWLWSSWFNSSHLVNRWRLRNDNPWHLMEDNLQRKVRAAQVQQQFEAEARIEKRNEQLQILAKQTEVKRLADEQSSALSAFSAVSVAMSDDIRQSKLLWQAAQEADKELTARILECESAYHDRMTWYKKTDQVVPSYDEAIEPCYRTVAHHFNRDGKYDEFKITKLTNPEFEEKLEKGLQILTKNRLLSESDKLVIQGYEQKKKIRHKHATKYLAARDKLEQLQQLDTPPAPRIYFLETKHFDEIRQAHTVVSNNGGRLHILMLDHRRTRAFAYYKEAKETLSNFAKPLHITTWDEDCDSLGTIRHLQADQVHLTGRGNLLLADAFAQSFVLKN